MKGGAAMQMVDFEYDGQLLSDFDCIPAEFITNFEDSTPLGMELTLNTVKVNDIDYITSSQYDEVLTKTFDVIKDPCRTTGKQDDLAFDDTDIYRISKWLQRKRFLKFKPLYKTDDFVEIVFYGYFTVKAIRLGDLVMGFTLTLITNAPYGFSDSEQVDRSMNWKTNKSNNWFEIYNNSQDIGYIYPDKVILTCHGNGTVTMTNTKDFQLSSEGKTQISTVIDNCVDGEVITMDCKNKIILSSRAHSNLYNDFNYNFPRLVTEYEEDDNRFEFDTSGGITGIDVTFIHSPIRKVGIM